VVNQNGIVVETRDYDPFGGDIAHVGAFSTQHRFTGQPADDQAGGLYNYGARFYNSKWGRFVSPDEVTQGFDSQGLNPYTYVENGPTSATDPTGELIWNGISYGAYSWEIVVQYGIQGKGPSSSSATSATQVGWGGATYSVGAKAVALGTPGAVLKAEFTPTPPDGKIHTPNPDLDPSAAPSGSFLSDPTFNDLVLHPVDRIGPGQPTLGDLVHDAADDGIAAGARQWVSDFNDSRQYQCDNGGCPDYNAPTPPPVVLGPASGKVATVLAERALATKLGTQLFSKGGLANSNRFFRIGLGRSGGESVLRIAIGRTGRFKLDLVNLGLIPKVGR
jgi:RHS repeat-associated protein